MKKIGIIIPAGGVGMRLGAEVPKQFVMLGERPMLARTIEAFRCVARYAQIVVALPKEWVEEWQKMSEHFDVPHHDVCEGGATRFESVKAALARLDEDCEYIAVHDGARPLVSGELILRAFEVARNHGSAIPVVPLADSIRRVGDVGSWPEDRTHLRAVQTPQVFRADILRTAYERAVGEAFTDDATVVESLGYTVMLCEGERRNLKITEPDDIRLAGALI